MKKLFAFLLIAASFAIVSCDKDFGDLNVDQKNPSEVPPGPLFANATKGMVDLMTNSNVNFNVFRILAQHWTTTTYTDEPNYDLTTRNIPQNFWDSMYVGVLRNLDEAQTLLTNEELNFVSAEQRANQNASIEIMTVYAYSVLVNAFGDVPYSEALDIENVSPKYDDAATIFNDILARLDVALASIDESADGFGSSDLLFGGDMSRWTQFGNSLKLRLGMMLADVDASKAAAIVEEAAPNVILTNDENVVFNYLGSTPNTNPIYLDLVQSQRQDYVAANTLVDIMLGLNDPRIEPYFTVDADSAYSGGIYAASNNFATYSKPDEQITETDFEAILIDAAEVEFLLAEAVERGMNVGGTAEEHYERAIRLSMEYWGVAEADIDAYIAQPEVAYSSADWKEKIGTQKWIALYNRGFDAWTEWRRLDYPILNVPDGLTYQDIPVRLTYPVREQTLNAASYGAASSAIGGDLVTTKLFWDKF